MTNFEKIIQNASGDIFPYTTMVCRGYMCCSNCPLCDKCNDWSEEKIEEWLKSEVEE